MTKLCLAFAALLATQSVPVHAQAFLLGADPAVGASVKAAPKQLRLNFSEGVELLFSGVEVTDGAGRGIPARDLRALPGDAAVLLLDMPPLAAGTYRVHWHVVSVDTHMTEGDFSFTIRP